MNQSSLHVWVEFAIFAPYDPGLQTKFPVQAQADISPEGFRRCLVCGRNPGVACAGPEPPVHVDRLELTLLASLALEVALAARGMDC